VRTSRVRLRNWMCFAGDHELELPAGPIGLVASYAANPRRSNWAGKTAFLESIEYALRGRHRKRVEDALITTGADELVVEWTLAGAPGGDVVVRRARPRGGPTVLHVSQGDRVLQRDAAEVFLEDLLRIDAEDERSTTWFRQDDVLALVAKTSGQRQETINRWLELTVWARAATRVGAKLRAAQAEVGAIVKERSFLPEHRDPELVEVDLASAAARVEELVGPYEELASLAKGGAARAAALAKVEALEGTLRAASKGAQAVREQKLDPVPADELEEARGAARAHAGALHEATAELAKAEQLEYEGFDGQCPVTCTACPAADQVREQADAVSRRVAAAGDTVDKLTGPKRDADKRLQALEDREQRVRSHAERLKESIASVRLVNERLVEARRQVPAQTTDAAAVADQLADLRQRLDDARRAEAGLRAELAAATGYVKRSAELETRHASAAAHLRALRLAAQAVGPGGIVARLAASQLDDLEDRVNALLAPASLGVTVAWSRETQDPATACGVCGAPFPKSAKVKECETCGAARGRNRVDELELLVDDGSGEVEDVSAKSGGAKVLVAAAVRLVAGAMLRERRGCPVQWALVDEPFGPLDAENREALARTFVGMLGRVGLEQAIVVSHDAALVAALPARIVVEREGRASRLRAEV